MSAAIRFQVPFGSVPGVTILQVPIDGGNVMHVAVPPNAVPGVTFLEVQVPPQQQQQQQPQINNNGESKGMYPQMPAAVPAIPATVPVVNNTNQYNNQNIPVAQMAIPANTTSTRSDEIAPPDDCCADNDCVSNGCCFYPNTKKADDDIKAICIGVIVMAVFCWLTLWGSFWASWGYISTIASVINSSYILNANRQASIYLQQGKYLLGFGIVTLLASCLALIQGIIMSVWIDQSYYQYNYSSGGYYYYYNPVAQSLLPFTPTAYVAWLFLMIQGSLCVDGGKKVIARAKFLSSTPGGGNTTSAYSSTGVRLPDATFGTGFVNAPEEDCCQVGCCFAPKSRDADKQVISLATGVITMAVFSWCVGWGSYWTVWSYISTIISVIISSQILQNWKQGTGIQSASSWGSTLQIAGIFTLLASIISLIQGIVLSVQAAQMLNVCRNTYGYSYYGTACWYSYQAIIPFAVVSYIAWLFLLIQGALTVDLGKKVLARGKFRTSAGVGGGGATTQQQPQYMNTAPAYAIAEAQTINAS
jgi:hypothetical protein